MGVQAAAFQREIMEKLEVLEKEIQRNDRGVKSTANVELHPMIEGTGCPPVAAEGAERIRSADQIRNVEQDDTGCRLSDGLWEPSGRSWFYTSNTPFKKEAGKDIGNGTFQMKSTRLNPQGCSC